tara:strand:+ start:4268 stop:4882 length:615 start_codon:yes stop_codon:yes gene_type:complete
MALIKINNQSLTNVTALPAGVGADGGFKFIKKVTLSSSNGTFSATQLFSADYNHYKLIWEINNSVNDVTTHFKLLKASDGSIDTAPGIDYAVHGIDNDGTGRNKYANNKTYFQVEMDDDDDGHKHFMEMNVYDPFNTEKTNITGMGVYTVNPDDDTTSYNLAASTLVTTSYSGMHLLVSNTVGGSVNSSNTITGRCMIYGMAEA